MKITNIIENTPGKSACQPEHGLSFYIETSNHKILMDTGASDLIINNATKLNTPLTEVDTVVISHGHYDHGGGLKAFLKINNMAKVYIHREALGEYYSIHEGMEPKYIGLLHGLKNHKQIITVDGLHKIINSEKNEEVDIEINITADVIRALESCGYKVIRPGKDK